MAVETKRDIGLSISNITGIQFFILHLYSFLCIMCQAPVLTWACTWRIFFFTVLLQTNFYVLLVL